MDWRAAVALFFGIGREGDRGEHAGVLYSTARAAQAGCTSALAEAFTPLTAYTFMVVSLIYIPVHRDDRDHQARDQLLEVDACLGRLLARAGLRGGLAVYRSGYWWGSDERDHAVDNRRGWSCAASCS